MDYSSEVTKHNLRLLTDPQYRMLEHMEDMRVEMMPGMWGETFTESPDSTTLKEPEWSRRQWGEVQQLKAQVLFLSNKINEMRANASKRKPKSKY